MKIHCHSQSYVIRLVWIRIIILLVIVITMGGILGGLFWIERKIPQGIFVANVETEGVLESYERIYNRVESYTDSDDLRNGVLIYPNDEFEQIISYTLKQRNPQFYVRNLYMERELRLHIIEILWILIGVQFLVLCSKVLLIHQLKSYEFVLHILAFFVICFVIRDRIDLPSSWIPACLINYGEWWSKITTSYSQWKEFGEIPCDRYQQLSGLRTVFIIAYGISVLAFGYVYRSVNKVLNKIREKEMN